jgi:tetratricopeptide (TPR) repeat protein
VLSELYRKVPGSPLSIGNRKRSLEEAQLAVKLDPNSTTYLLELAESYIANKDKVEAKKTLQKVIDMTATPGEPVESQKDKVRARELLQDLD